MLARAEDLAGIPDASIDVATSRSVLIYVADKQRAFDELYRVLVPGGRISLFEPINRLMFPEPEDRFWGYNVAAVAELAGKVKDTFTRLEHADAATMMDFDERDLFAMARRAGFASIHLELHTNLITGRPGIEAPGLETLLDSSPHPLAPTLREALEQALDPVEQARFLDCLDTALKRNDSQLLWAAVFLLAHKTAGSSAAGRRGGRVGRQDPVDDGLRTLLWHPVGHAVEHLDVQLWLACDRPGGRSLRHSIRPAQKQRRRDLERGACVAASCERHDLTGQKGPVHGDRDSRRDVLGEAARRPAARAARRCARPAGSRAPSVAATRGPTTGRLIGPW